MGKPSKTGAKAAAASAAQKKATQSRVAAPKRVSKSMRKLLAKNAKKAKNRVARVAKLAGPARDVMILDEVTENSI